jgi:hypothetical protein
LEVLRETGLLLGVRPQEAYADSEFSFEVGDLAWKSIIRNIDSLKAGHAGVGET